MKLKTIFIRNFGKLKNFRLDLNPELNIIYGSNESGKTTVMNFIKMVFYGTSGKSQDISRNLRKKYAPWDGSPMSGYIEFESDGQNYRIEREFGNSNISDSITVWNLSSGVQEPASCKLDPGEQYIGMSASAFERSVFIGDISAVIHGADKEDEITRKLMNYSSSAEENISYEIVRKRLRNAHEEIHSKTRKSGAADKLMTGLSDLTERLSKAEEDEENRQADEELHASYCEHLERKKQRHDRLAASLKEQHIIRELHSLEVQSRKNAVKTELEEKINNLTGQISNGSFTVTEAFLDECSEMLSKLRRLKESYSDKKSEFNSLSSEISELRLNESIEETESELDRANEELTAASQQLGVLNDELSAVTSSLDEINDLIRETQIKEELYRERLADMEPNYIVLLPCALLLVVAVSLFIKNPWFLLAAIPVCAIVILGTKLVEAIAAFRDKRAGIEHKAPDYEEAYRSFDIKKEELNNRTGELNTEISLAADRISGIQAERTKLETETERLKMLSEQKKSALEKLGSELSKYGNDISELGFHITDYFSEYRSVSNTSEIPDLIDSALDIISEIEKTKAVYDSKLEEDIFHDSPEQIAERTAVLKEKLSTLTGDSGPKLLSDSQTDSLEEELEESAREIDTLSEQIAEMRNTIASKYHSSDSPSILRKEADSIREKLSGMAHYDRAVLIASEVMEEAGNEIRQTFAPELNSKTEKIFSHLTGGKYSEAVISREFEISSAAEGGPSLHEWQYLSTGTYEQAYFSLRLALSDMMAGNRVPVCLDDVFAHYDEERARKGFMFLNEYSRINQVIFFTCHRYGAVSDQYTVFPGSQ